jgi:AcrR family transcriptional regulator
VVAWGSRVKYEPRTMTGRRPPRREDEVVEAAVTVFSNRGYGAATVQQVADELGINKGSLYHYINSKEDLLLRIFDQIHADAEHIIDEVVAAPDEVTALQRLALYVYAQVDYSLVHRRRLAIYHQEMDHLVGERRDEVRERRREHGHIVTTLIRDAQRDGVVDADADVRTLSNILFALVASSYRWVRPDDDEGRAASAANCTAFILRGITGTLPDELDDILDGRL